MLLAAMRLAPVVDAQQQPPPPLPGSYEILRTDCTGKAVVMEGSPYEIQVEVPPAARTLELLHQMINTRGAATCSAWSEEEFGEQPAARLLRPALALDA